MRHALIMLAAGIVLAVMILALPWAQKPATVHNIQWVATHDWSIEVTGTVHEIECGFRNDGTMLWRPGKVK